MYTHTQTHTRTLVLKVIKENAIWKEMWTQNKFCFNLFIFNIKINQTIYDENDYNNISELITMEYSIQCVYKIYLIKL